mmetsp:Transcript_7085/g.15351  ORF Transcript_7085/g.15351 Transcript_7085/m.15351 type:complete len:222 (+) Transcript_7085:589-1254(+)
MEHFLRRASVSAGAASSDRVPRGPVHRQKGLSETPRAHPMVRRGRDRPELRPRGLRRPSGGHASLAREPRVRSPDLVRRSRRDAGGAAGRRRGRDGHALRSHLRRGAPQRRRDHRPLPKYRHVYGRRRGGGLPRRRESRLGIFQNCVGIVSRRRSSGGRLHAVLSGPVWMAGAHDRSFALFHLVTDTLLYLRLYRMVWHRRHSRHGVLHGYVRHWFRIHRL